MTGVSDGWRLGHRPALDGLRGVAVLLVIAGHGLWQLDRAAGSAGVMVFFALSGFLITSILIEGQGFARFYRNRALRLLPALAAFLLVAVPVQQAVFGNSPWSAWPVVLYVGNWVELPHVLTHTWSLAVEEQFYFAWPLAIAAVRRWRNGPLMLCLVGLAFSAALRLPLWDSSAGARRIYVGSDTEAFALLCGCLLAVLAHRGLATISRRWGILAALVIGGCSLMASGPTAQLVLPLLCPPSAAVAIWAVLPTVTGWLASRSMRYVGARSYALYLWHPVALLIGMRLVDGVLQELVVGLALTVLVAEVSWRLVEQPFVRLKNRAVRSHHQATEPVFMSPLR